MSSSLCVAPSCLATGRELNPHPVDFDLVEMSAVARVKQLDAFDHACQRCMSPWSAWCQGVRPSADIAFSACS